MTTEFAIIIKTTIILLCACLTVSVMRRASSSTRHALWLIALISALLLPVASILLPVLDLPVMSPPLIAIAAERERGALPPATMQRSPNASRFSFSVPKRASGDPSPSVTFTVQEAISAIWVLGFLCVFTRLALATRVVRRFAIQSQPITDENWNCLRAELQDALRISKPVQLRIGGSMPPMTWGAFRHVILLPESAETWTIDRRRVVLAHELAHVKRHDGMIQVLVQVVCSVYWFSPMVWYAAHRLRNERERACDDQVLNLGAVAEDYADHLLQIARGIRPGPSFAAVSMADPSQLETRLISILNRRAKRRRLSRMAVMGMLTVIGVLTASIAAIQVTALAAMALPSFETPLRAPSWIGKALAAPAQEQAIPPASLEGVVVRSGSSDPLARVRVILNPISGGGSPLTVATDDSGRFAIQDVPPGRYQLIAAREGYVRALYGQRTPGGAGVPMTLASKQTLSGVVLAMAPTAAISGKIRNRLGELVANVAVRAQKYEYESGHPVLTLVETVRTNDLGEYRLYYLEPARYLVSALPPTGIRLLASENSPNGRSLQTGSVEVLPGSPFTGSGASTIGRSGMSTAADGLSAMGFVSSAATGETFLPVFFPGVADPAAASPINLKSGETFGAVDFTVSEVRALRIRGQATNGATGQPLRGVSMVLMSDGLTAPGVPIDHYGAVSDTGSFDFQGIAPGSYVLVASTGALPRGIPSIEEGVPGGAVIKREVTRFAATNAAAPRLAVRLPLQVGNSDLDNISLPLQSGFIVTGKISIEGLSAAESAALTAGLVIHLQSDRPDIVPENRPNQRVQTAATPATVAADGTFSIASVFAGTYQIGIFNGAKLPKDAYVQSARFDDKDALNPRLIIDGPPRSTLEIVIAKDAGAFEAVVTDNNQKPAAGMMVVIVPDASRGQHYDLYRFAVTDDLGHAHLENLPPGDYTAYALDEGMNGVWWDPEFSRKYSGTAKPLHVNEGGKHMLDLKWTPIP